MEERLVNGPVRVSAYQCCIQLLTLFAVCGGASQSYANGAWDDAAASPMSDVMSGTLPAGQEVVSG